MREEIWRSIPSYPEYQASSFRIFSSLQECGEYLGVTRGNISRVLTGERKGQAIHGYHIE